MNSRRHFALIIVLREGGCRMKSTEPPLTRGPSRIGVYICHCGTNIAGMVDVEAVARFASTLRNVTVARPREDRGRAGAAPE